MRYLLSVLLKITFLMFVAIPLSQAACKAPKGTYGGAWSGVYYDSNGGPSEYGSTIGWVNFNKDGSGTMYELHKFSDSEYSSEYYTSVMPAIGTPEHVWDSEKCIGIATTSGGIRAYIVLNKGTEIQFIDFSANNWYPSSQWILKKQ